MASDKNSDEPEEQKKPGSLVPVYAGRDIARGVQAYRRGNVILYTVRGEPREVLELVGELDKDGVDEVVALISHRSEDAPEEREVQSEPEEEEPED